MSIVHPHLTIGSVGSSLSRNGHSSSCHYLLFITRPVSFFRVWVYSHFEVTFISVNIHTHLVPFVLWGWHSIPFFSSTLRDVPETAFTAFALLCLFTSALWHTMSGCAHPAGIEFFARVDYVGIGWHVISLWFIAFIIDTLHQVDQCKRWHCRALWFPVSSPDRQLFSSLLFLYGFGGEHISFHELVQPI
jgi:hypothetical protein